jgi:putative ABC transport system substrate-binding protein
MKNKIVTLPLCAMLLAVCGSVDAQQPKKLFRIGYLSSLSRSSDPRAEPFRQALRDLGYIEGQNVAIEYRYAEGKRGRLPELAAALVRLKVDIIVAGGGDPGIRAAKNATKRIPIVMTGGGLDPVEAGYVESLARPGGNVTGFTNLTRDLGGKRLELLKEAVPKIASVSVLYDSSNPASVREVKELLPVAACPLNLTIQPREVRAADDYDGVFDAMGKQRSDGLYVASSGPIIVTNQERIVSFALKRRLPSVYSNRRFVGAGGLMSYGRTRRTTTDASHITWTES